MHTARVSALILALMAGSVHAGGAACVMAKYQGATLDYALVYGKSHPVEAQEAAEDELQLRGAQCDKLTAVIRRNRINGLREQMEDDAESMRPDYTDCVLDPLCHETQ